MIQPELPVASGRRWQVWAAAALVLLVGAAVLIVGGAQGQDRATSAPTVPTFEGSAAPTRSATATTTPAPGSATAAAEPAPDGAPAGAPPVVAGAPPVVAGGPPVVAGGQPVVAGARPVVAPAERAAPIELRIPAIGVSTSMTELGLKPDNTVEVPADFQQAGWFEPGPSPGQTGSAVILGHVDSTRGPAVFYRLRSLRPNDAVDVVLADGAIAHFAVTAVETYPKDRFPAEQVYGPRGGSGLQLVTCGGEFDRAARSYLSNVVAYTTLVAVTPP